MLYKLEKIIAKSYFSDKGFSTNSFKMFPGQVAGTALLVLPSSAWFGALCICIDARIESPATNLGLWPGFWTDIVITNERK